VNLEREILKADFKDQAVFVANAIGGDEDMFAELMRLFFSNDIKTCQRAAWIVSHCAERNSWQIIPYIDKLVKNMYNDITDATKRNTVRVLQFVDIPEELWGEIIEICFKYLVGKEAVAIKVFSMTILYNLSLKVPEITNELKVTIEDQLPYGSAGFKSRGKKVLQQISKPNWT
jgi:hypothetical protein